MKILILRFSSIGDIILTTPVVRCLKAQFPEVEIHYLTRASYRSLLENLPGISKVICFEKSAFETIAELKLAGYDHIIDLHKNLRTKRLLLKLGRRAHSFPKLNIRKWLKVQLKINCLPPIHIVDRYLKAVAFLGVVNDHQGLDYVIPKSTSISETIFLASQRLHYTVIVIGAKQFTKQIPEEHILYLCKSIQGNVVLLGGKDETAKADQIMQQATGVSLINLCGLLDLNQSALLLEGATNIITADTGMMHLAAALKKEVISVWGNTIPAFGMSPYFPSGMEQRSHIIENNTLGCRPCTKLGYKKCPKKHFKCMMDLNMQEIMQWVK